MANKLISALGRAWTRLSKSKISRTYLKILCFSRLLFIPYFAPTPITKLMSGWTLSLKFLNDKTDILPWYFRQNIGYNKFSILFDS